MLRAALLLHASVRALDPSVFGRFRTWPITAVQELEQPLRDMGLNVPAAEIVDDDVDVDEAPNLSV